MAFATKKQHGATPAPSSSGQQQQFHVDRDAVDTASRLTSGMINQMTDQIFRETAKEVEKKQK